MRLGKVSVLWNGLLPSIVNLVRPWTPAAGKKEIAYRDELLALLHQALPEDAKVEKEYRTRGTTVDLWIRWNGFFVNDELHIELKVNLRRKTEFDRLVGQIESLEPASNRVLVMLIGDSDPALVQRLQRKYVRLIEPPTGITATMAVVQTRVTNLVDAAPLIG